MLVAVVGEEVHAVDVRVRAVHVEVDHRVVRAAVGQQVGQAEAALGVGGPLELHAVGAAELDPEPGRRGAVGEQDPHPELDAALQRDPQRLVRLEELRAEGVARRLGGELYPALDLGVGGEEREAARRVAARLPATGEGDLRAGDRRAVALAHHAPAHDREREHLERQLPHVTGHGVPSQAVAEGVVGAPQEDPREGLSPQRERAVAAGAEPQGRGRAHPQGPHAGGQLEQGDAVVVGLVAQDLAPDHGVVGGAEADPRALEGDADQGRALVADRDPQASLGMGVSVGGVGVGVGGGRVRRRPRSGLGVSAALLRRRVGGIDSGV